MSPLVEPGYTQYPGKTRCAWACVPYMYPARLSDSSLLTELCPKILGLRVLTKYKPVRQLLWTGRDPDRVPRTEVRFTAVRQQQDPRYRMAWAVVRKHQRRPYPTWVEDAVQDMVTLAASRPDLPNWKLWLRMEDVLGKQRNRAGKEAPAGLLGLQPGEGEGRFVPEGAGTPDVDERVDAGRRVAELYRLPLSVTERVALDAVYEAGDPAGAAVSLGWSTKRVRNQLDAIRRKAIETGLGL